MSPKSDRLLRILILRHAGFPGDPRVRREAAALVAAGHHVEVICASEPELGQKRRETVGGVEVTRMPVQHLRRGIVRYFFEYGAFFVLAALTVAFRSLRRPYDVVQVNTMPDALVFAAIGARWRGAAILIDLHELMPELYASKFAVKPDHALPRLLGFVEQRAIRFADHALAVSRPCLDRFVARGAERKRFSIVMNVADPALFGADARLSGQAPTPRPRIVSHGTIVARYGFDVLLRAMAEVPEADLEIIGDGPERPALERLAIELGISERVAFLGRVKLEDVPRLVAGATAGVVANRSDPFTDLVVPTKLMEYVALGIPAIVARTPAVESYFGSDAVCYVTPGDVRDLIRALRVVIAEPELRQEMVRRADETFGEEFRWQDIASGYVELVERMAIDDSGQREQD